MPSKRYNRYTTPVYAGIQLVGYIVRVYDPDLNYVGSYFAQTKVVDPGHCRSYGINHKYE